MIAEEQGSDEEKGMYIPICNEMQKPHKGKIFKSLEEGIAYYKQYAKEAGFDVRISSAKKAKDTIIWRYIVWSREGEKHHGGEDANAGGDSNKRQRVSMRCGCMARVVFKYEAEYGYVVNLFVEGHNHPLIESEYKHFMKANRNLDEVQQKFILDCAKANIGPTQSYKMIKEIMGGYEGIGCALADVQNFSRDMKAYVEGSDAHMLLNEMRRKRELCAAFTYEYVVNHEDKLKMVFWCDPVARRNYHMFGDVVAFDTTYSTNKYCMIFAPITGKDNHGRPVSFGAALLSKEDADSFSWLLKKFLLCMGAAPKIIITDQDLAMKASIEQEMPHTRHRWCMWHIMLKVCEKVPKELQSNEEFKKELNSYVWSEVIEPEVFELGWCNIMVRYELEETEWFKTMYEARRNWVSAYFRDIAMSGLVRTTSIAEYENSFFKRYTRSRSNLLEFWMNFNHAIEAQRQANAQMNYMDNAAFPSLDTTMSLEKHAATIYTATIFKRFQEELTGTLFYCRILNMTVEGSSEEYKIEDEFNQTYKVLYKKVEETCDCSCKMFVRKGILCRHMLFVYKNKRIKQIPEKYISGRWKKQNLVEVVHGFVNGQENSYNGEQEQQRLKNNIVAVVFGLIQKIEGNKDKLGELLERINEAGGKIVGEASQETNKGKTQLFEEFYGTTVPATIEVMPPTVIKTKGSGSRLISRKEKAVRMKNKPPRKCAKCKQMVNHDARNCHKVGKEADKT